MDHVFAEQLQATPRAGNTSHPIHTIAFPGGLKLLVLAPHPDDFDAIAVTLRFFKDGGHAIDLAVLTSGASGVDDDFLTASTPEAKARLREEEQRESCRRFGLSEARLAFLRLEEDAEGHPIHNGENTNKIRQHFTEKEPDLVFLPHGNDTNPGHQRAYAMFREIAAAVSRPLAAFYNRDPKTIAMRADLHTPFGEEDAQWKAALLRCHASQHARNLKVRGHGFDERILEVNRREARDGAPYAETFELECWL